MAPLALVPREAARWICSLPEISKSPTLEDRLIDCGLDVLYVKDLKHIHSCLRRYPFCHSIRTPAKKANLAFAIRRSFYIDDACTLVNHLAMAQLSGVRMPLPPRGVAPPRLPVLVPQPAWLPPHHATTMAPAPRAVAPSAAAASTAPAPHPHHMAPGAALAAAMARSFAGPPAAYRSAAAAAAAAAAPHRTSPSPPKSKRDFRAAFGVKTEGDPATHAQNMQEATLLESTLAMGFTDRFEILVAIRKLYVDRGDEAPVSSDDVMCELIAARERTEEARQMDLARLESEQQRKREAAARRQVLEQETEQRVRSAGLVAWRNDAKMFQGSWILESSLRGDFERLVGVEYSPVKKGLRDLLELEKKARKWFKLLPFEYFADRVVTRLQPFVRNTKDLVAQLTDEVQVLERVMFSLEEQQGGVPRIFLEAHDEAAPRRDENDVVVVTTTTTVSSPKESSTTANNHKRQRPSPASPQSEVNQTVIEILD